MPHIVVRLWPGRSDEQKAQLTDAIVRDVTSILHASDESVSVAFEEVAPEEWTDQVFEPEIRDKWDTLTKKPGYYGPKPEQE